MVLFNYLHHTLALNFQNGGLLSGLNHLENERRRKFNKKYFPHIPYTFNFSFNQHYPILKGRCHQCKFH